MSEGVARVWGAQMLLDLLHPRGRVVVGRYGGMRPARWRLAHLRHRTDVAQAAEGSIGRHHELLDSLRRDRLDAGLLLLADVRVLRDPAPSPRQRDPDEVASPFARPPAEGYHGAERAEIAGAVVDRVRRH